MYLSKLKLNLLCKQVRSEMNAPYEMHRTLMKAFAYDENIQNSRLLFRIDKPKNNSINEGLTVFVQSFKIKPNWDLLSINDLYFLEQPLTKEVDLSKLTIGVYKFKLKANPTVKRNGKRYGLYDKERQQEWIRRKGDIHGFEPIYTHCSDFNIGSKSKTDKMNSSEMNKSDIYHFGVNYEGVLRITDTEKVIHALYSGIGSAKAFGFGLLTIARI